LKKKAVVLLITLGFIAVITALVMQTVSLSKSSFDDLMSIKNQNQLSLYMLNLTNLLQSQNESDIKDYLVDQGDIPIFDEKSGVNISISCRSLDKRLNLNKLLSCDKEECDDVIKTYAKELELADDDYFLALLKDTVAPQKNQERRSGSKIILDDKTFSDGCILTYKTIEQIQEKYFAEVRDPNIFKIKKDEFLDMFYLLDLRVKDSNESSPSDRLSQALGCLENDDSCQKEFLKINNSLKNITNCAGSENNQTIQTKYLIQCKINIYKGDESHSVVFKYNLDKKAKKRVVSIDEFF